MNYGIQDDFFDELVQKGLLQDIINLSTTLGATLEVLSTSKGWLLTVRNNGSTVQLERKSDSLVLSLLDQKRSKEYPCDADELEIDKRLKHPQHRIFCIFSFLDPSKP